jgi:hypothetical protein
MKRFQKRIRPSVFLLCAALAVWWPAPAAQSRPAHKRSLADYFGPFLDRRLNDCRTCHLPDPPDGPAEGKPHNAFGARLKAVKEELRLAGKKTDLVSRLEAIADEDSDGDGVPNLIELLTGHAPGDPGDKPTVEEVAAARQKLADFRRYQDGYHWRPMEPVHRPVVPFQNTPWVRNPIDAFIAAGQAERGLQPRPEADRCVLLRRVTLDLTGLPPTPEELHVFLADPAPDAYEHVVDRLLASPRYGERWGRHWMDVWRYSDWAGFGAEVRDSQPHVWRWRDWIVESLNQDKGYDRMVVEMLAGDEVAPGDTDTLRATGYLVRNYKRYSREKWLQDTVEHTFHAFLGTTLACARCHDHMYDPLMQRDYYRVRAVFEPYQVRIDRLPGQADLTRDGLARAFDAQPDAKTFLLLRGDDRTPDKDPLDPGVPEAMGGSFPSVEPAPLPVADFCPDRREFVQTETLADSAASIPKAEATLAATRQRVVSLFSAFDSHPLPALALGVLARQGADALSLAELDVPLAKARDEALRAVIQVERLEDNGQKDTPEWRLAAAETVSAQRQVTLLEARRVLLVASQAHASALEDLQAEAAKKVTEAEAALAKAEAAVEMPTTMAYTPRPVPVYPRTSTGRRLAFARWVVGRDNPLAARVAMNHIWLRHFGQAIVPSVFDFGRNGRPPSHPALLDWLAAEFMERNWSMKAMHRLIVTSSAYRMASTPDPADLALDRDNTYLWRMTPRRVEAEVVRDCIFDVAGRLDLSLGGPDLDSALGMTVPRRSLYFRHAAEKQMEFLKIFDCADVYECYQRKRSVLPQQALALVNSELTLQHARLLARSLSSDPAGNDPEAFVTAAFERVLCRPPTSEEQSECVAFLEERTRRYNADKTNPSSAADPEGRVPAADAALRARENLVHVLLNHHEFVTLR